MKTTHLLAPLSVAALLALTTTASSQARTFTDVDRNGDGVLSYGELVSSFGQAGANRLWSRGDGRALSAADIGRINAGRDDDDDDGPGVRRGRDDDDDDGPGVRRGRDDDDDDGPGVRRGRDDDDDD